MPHYAYDYFGVEEMGEKVIEIDQTVQPVSGRLRLPKTYIHTHTHSNTDTLTQDLYLHIYCFYKSISIHDLKK